MSTVAAQLDSPVTSSDQARISSKKAQVSGTRNRLNTSEGRIGVLSFAARSLLAFVIMMLAFAPLMGVAFLSGEFSGEKTEPNSALMIPAMIFSVVGIIYGFWLSVVSTIKRLHDIGNSGWFYLFFLIPIIGTLYFVYVSLKPGEDDLNNFGEQSVPGSMEKFAGYIGIVFLLGAISISLVSSAFDLKTLFVSV